MFRITRDDIQSIGDEETLLHFLREKLNLPIPEGATLAQIALPLPLHFLGLDDAIAQQIIDCQDFSGLPKNALGARRPFLIRFKREQNYAEILRRVAESLSEKNINPADLLFICADAYVHPFAFAYFNDSDPKNWEAEVLNVFIWAWGNMCINTGLEHTLPASFFPCEPSTQPDNLSQDNIEDEETLIPDEPEDDIEASSSEDQNRTDPRFIVKHTSSESLFAKVQNTGAPLRQYSDIHGGIFTGCNDVFVIDESKREQLISEDINGRELIKPVLVPKRKWETRLTYFIWIPSSADRTWPWSDAEYEPEAKQIFEKSFPAISAHLSPYENQLKRRGRQGKFYWELSKNKLSSIPKCPKIVYSHSGPHLRASYDTSEALPVFPGCFIPTGDLSLLAILNSTLFSWYAQTYRVSEPEARNKVDFRRGFMENVPIAGPTEAQKENLSQFVQQILAAPRSLAVPDFEKEIDALVYELYELSDTEIALITEQVQSPPEPRGRRTLSVAPRNAQYTDTATSQVRTDVKSLLATPQNTEPQPTISVLNLIVDEKSETPSIASVSSGSLLAKLENVGTPLARNVNIFRGSALRYTAAFVIDGTTSQQLIAEDPKSAELIEAFPAKSGKWKWKSRNIIHIPSSKNKQWPWSDIMDSSEAEQVFKENYPAISKHIKHYKDELNTEENRARFYWEFPSYRVFPRLTALKIIYRASGPSVSAAYDISGGVLLKSAYFIPTTDLHLLAILNSKLCSWYAHRKFKSPNNKYLLFSQKNMKKIPIVSGTEAQERELSDLVELILDAPDDPEVPDIEREIDKLVYELYELTKAEIALIEKGMMSESFSYRWDRQHQSWDRGGVAKPKP